MGFGQEMDGCGRFMKYGLFICNFLTCIGGLVVLSLGIWMCVDRMFINELLGTNLYQGAVYILIATGILITIVSFFGCMGAAKEVKCLLLTYNILLLILFVTMLVGGILGYVFREKVKTSMEREMHASLGRYGNREEYTTAWDATQYYLECCGVDDYRDWESINMAWGVPESCCKEIVRGGAKLPCTTIGQKNSAVIHVDGCLRKGIDFMRENGAILGTAGIIVALLMVFGIIFSCVLFLKIE